MLCMHDEQLEIIQRVCAYLEAHLEDNPTLADISTHVHMSPFYLQRMFKRAMGITPRQYIEGRRLEQLKDRLRDGENVTRALYNVGYGSSSRLYEHPKLGMTPATYRKGGEGMAIRYSIVTTALGRLLVGKTERGICLVLLGDDDADLENYLFTEYPAAEIRRDQDDFCEWVSALIEHLEGWRPHLELPLDLQATAFEWRVWHELQAIPYGETRTYREIAEAIGQPKAASAVARAVTANPAMLVIPCHRTSREDGQPSEYYTSERSRRNKQRLVQHEHAKVTQAQNDSEPGT